MKLYLYLNIYNNSRFLLDTSILNVYMVTKTILGNKSLLEFPIMQHFVKEHKVLYMLKINNKTKFSHQSVDEKYKVRLKLIRDTI